MHKRLGSTKFSLVLLLAVLLSAVPFAGALANEYDVQTLEEKMAQLEADLLGLRGLVKALTVDIQKVADSSNTDIGEFQPRLYTVEKVSKENAFEIKLLKGSVAELSTAVSSLEELRPDVYQAKSTMKELKAFFMEHAEIFAGRIEANEQTVEDLNKYLHETLIIIGVLEGQIQPITVRLDTLSEHVLIMAAETDAIHAGLETIATNQAQATATINGHVGQLDRQVAQLEEALEELNRVSHFATEIEVQITELIVRSTESEQVTLELTEFLAEFEKFDREAQDMRNQVEQLGSQILFLAEKADENSAQISQNMAKLDRLEQLAAEQAASGNGPGTRLEQKINEAFLQFASTQDSLDALQQSLANAREEVKRDVLREMPRIPTTDEIVLQIEETAAAQIQEANARADQAQSVALIALATGVAAIVVSLLLP